MAMARTLTETVAEIIMTLCVDSVGVGASVGVLLSMRNTVTLANTVASSACRRSTISPVSIASFKRRFEVCALSIVRYTTAKSAVNDPAASQERPRILTSFAVTLSRSTATDNTEMRTLGSEQALPRLRRRMETWTERGLDVVAGAVGVDDVVALDDDVGRMTSQKRSIEADGGVIST